jgi:DNA processing protein
MLNDRIDEDMLRALILGLRNCTDHPTKVKTEIQRLLLSASRPNEVLFESIFRVLVDLQYLDSSRIWKLINKYMSTIRKLRERGISVLLIPDNDYPRRFKQLSDVPLILLAKGNLEALNPEKSIAIIGSRNADNLIYTAGIEISFQLAQRGWMIASGLAKGCDSAGHIGCIRGNGITTAILPCSIEKIYPSDNIGLAEEIVAHNGCLATEYLYSDSIQKYFFIQRDRLQAALADYLIVLQTGLKGGSMHTVRYACQYNKQVFSYMPLGNYPQKIDMSGNKELISTNKAIGFTDIDSLLASMQATSTKSEQTLCKSTDESSGSCKDPQHSDQLDFLDSEGNYGL